MPSERPPIQTLGQLLVNEALPLKYRDYGRTLAKDEADALLAAIAKSDPDKYREISHKLLQLGSETSFLEGSSLKLSDLAPVMDKADLLKHVREQDDRINSSKDMTEQEKDDARTEVYGQIKKLITDQTYDAAIAAGNPFGMQVKTKARGSKAALSDILTAPGTYQDPQGRTIPMFIGRSYAEGLSPAEYWAATPSARVGLVSTKLGTRQGGYLGKQLGVAAITQIVTKDDCGTPYGIPVKADDADNLGSVLARPVGQFQAGTVIDRDVLSAVKKDNTETIVVRSPTTCALPEGLCKICVGKRENGKFPELGDNIGLNAASAVAERIAQGSLNTKHSGRKAKGATEYSGFPVIEQLVQVPSTFANSAAMADVDGTVDNIEAAPQGGMNVYVDGNVHYVPPQLDVTVAIGDKVEAGDLLSDGITNPSEVVRYKGLGEGRRYFTDRFTQALRDSKFDVNRRNVEVLSRALIDHVEVDDPDGAGSYLPGDVAKYSAMAATYVPRKDSKVAPLSQAVGQYLEQPVLHYTIGTKVTQKMIKQLKPLGITQGQVHPQHVGFTPKMVSMVKNPQYEKDWMAQLSSNYLESRLLKSVHRGAESDRHGLHPIPGIAYSAEFGEPKDKKVGY